MKDVLQIFFLTSIISFAGSMQIGSVNLAVIQTTLNRNFRAGLMVAFGGCLPEIIYTIIAFQGQVFLQKSKYFTQIFAWLVIPIFLGLGIYYFFQNQNYSIQKKDADKKGFWKGFLLGLLNPQLLTFWLLILVYLDSFFKINTLPTKSAFVLGAAFGAFVILYIFVYFSDKYQGKILNLLTKYPLNKIIGLLFIALAFIQVFKEIDF